MSQSNLDQAPLHSVKHPIPHMIENTFRLKEVVTT